MDDLIDVLGEDGRVAGTLPRAQAHREGRLHRSVHLFAFDPQGRLWLQKRALDRALHPGLWTSSASGHLDAGEVEEKAVVREAAEEVGLDVRPRRVAEFKYVDTYENEVVGLWEARTSQLPKPGPEVMAVMALSREELAALRARLPGRFAPSFQAALRAYGWA